MRDSKSISQLQVSNRYLHNYLISHFSHFEEEYDEDKDTKDLRNSLQKVSGNCRELATPIYIDKVRLLDISNSPPVVISQDQMTGELWSSTSPGRSSGRRSVICEDIPTQDSARLPWQRLSMKFFCYVMALYPV